MSWIATSGGGQSWICPKVFGTACAPRDALMARGSIVLETRLSPEGRPQTLLHYERRHPWNGSISVRAVPGGSIALVLTQNSEVFHTVLQPPHDARTDVLRVTFSWDTRQRFGRIAVERPESDQVIEQSTPPPPPLLIEDIHTIARRPQLRQMDEDVVFFAVSTDIEPIGPMPTLTGQVQVLTPTGYRAVGQLQCGDTIKTREHGVVPVLHRVSRLVPALGAFRPIRLRAPYFGLHRDLIVSPQQRLVIGGSDVEYLFGREAVLIPAQSLVNGFAAVHEDGHRFVRYHQLLLPRHEPIIAAEADLESLYIGRLRRDRDRVASSLLADCPSGLLPEHARAGLKVLGSFEAITLAEARAA
ncbi:Hint domain-containing protein [Tropicibacter oceani]|uniref:Hint domain-containing protein n=1 Tax=Tropicibacter oceani TaxID=3058420 RepID=A0ABY8QKH6_9RHOB|nr:Hint domain-containing protein [Tropicibacter oceani]WGW05141.1 Hint domain-containing protein [Tropicibacter oceani]